MRLRYFYVLSICLILPGLPGCTSKSPKPAVKVEPGSPRISIEQRRELPQQDSTRLQKFLSGTVEKKEFGESIQRFYKSVDFHLAWFNDSGMLAHAPKFISRLKASSEDGLNPEDFHVDRLQRYLDLIHSAAQKDENYTENTRDFDLLLTTEFHRYGAQLCEGITRHFKDSTGWYIRTQEIRYDTLLSVILADNRNQDPFKRLDPPQNQYKQLKAMLRNYRNYVHNGGWKPITGVKKLKIGDTADAVVTLRERLAITNDLRTTATNFFNPRIFDKNLELSVQSFQTRYGLNPDGVVSGKTLQALNEPVHKRIRQLLINMERWRLMPRNLGNTFLVVNLPEYRLHVYENNKEMLNMRVVVGKEFKSTPIFNDKLEYIVFSPYWNIPKSITVEEVLPLIYKDPKYLEKNHMEVVKGFTDPPAVVNNFYSVPWRKIDDPGFDYRIRQRPGDDNPLGLVKFIFPNNHNVYLHDTPADQLFSRIDRAYSHGCIRIEYPVKLAQFLLKDQKEWNEKAILEAMNKGVEQYVHVPPTQVYILYITNWVADGQLQVRGDLYGLDEGMAFALGI